MVFGYLLARIVISALVPAALLPRRNVHRLRAHAPPLRRADSQAHRRHVPGFARAWPKAFASSRFRIIIAIILGTGEVASILVIVCLTLFYTFEGGMTAVIWTDVVQMFLYVAGAILSFFVILHQIPGGWAHVSAVAGAAHKFQMFDFRFSWTADFFSRNYSFWAGIIGGCFLTTASHGTEQLMVQRLLAAKNEAREPRGAVSQLGCDLLPVRSVPLDRDAAVCPLFRRSRSGAAARSTPFIPHFIWHNLPPGSAGLVMAAILAAGMSNLSAA